jgi:NADH-quinone oxidoreductase subunit J
MDWVVFGISAIGAIVGAIGVVLSRNTVHAALSLVMTLFSVAVFFVLQEAHFLAAVQVIVYAGAIVVLFLFVIMLIGVDREEELVEPLRFQRLAAFVGGGALLVLLGILFLQDDVVTGEPATRGPALAADPRVTDGSDSNIDRIGRALFSDYVWAFELVGLLLVVAVVGAVVLVRKQTTSPTDRAVTDRAQEGATR